MNRDVQPPEPTAPSRPRSRRRLRTGLERRQRRRRIITYALFVFSFVLMVDALIGENGYLATVRARREYDALAEFVTRLRQENDAYVERARRLRGDPAALEDAARRELGFVRPGETLVIIRDARPATPPPPVPK
jgi:cell division protein FtsB